MPRPLSTTHNGRPGSSSRPPDGAPACRRWWFGLARADAGGSPRGVRIAHPAPAALSTASGLGFDGLKGRLASDSTGALLNRVCGCTLDSRPSPVNSGRPTEASPSQARCLLCSPLLARPSRCRAVPPYPPPSSPSRSGTPLPPWPPPQQGHLILLLLPRGRPFPPRPSSSCRRPVLCRAQRHPVASSKRRRIDSPVSAPPLARIWQSAPASCPLPVRSPAPW
jgi:hypothetical protein